MQVHVEEISPVKKKVSFEIPAERVDGEIEKFFAGIQKRAKIQGFRPGKAPLPLVKRTYGDAMRDEVMRRLYDQTLFATLEERKIEPVDSPTIESDILEQGVPFKYSAVVEVMPEIELKDYIGLPVQKEKYIPHPENVEGELARMQEKMAQLVPLGEDAAVENGHVVTVDYSFSVEGFPEENSTADDTEIEVGAKRLIPGLEEQLIGMKCGESKEIRLTLPDGYHNSEAAGKEGICQVTIKEIKRKDLPELDDEFAGQFGNYKTIEELRAKMAEYHEKHERDRIESEFKERLIKALVENNPLEVPESLVKRQLASMLEHLKNRLKSQNSSIEAMGLDEEGFRDRFHDVAADKVRGGLLLMALVEKENISVEESDFTKYYEQFAAGNPDMLNRIKEYYESNKKARNTLIAEIKEDNAINFLMKNAVVTEVDASEIAAE